MAKLYKYLHPDLTHYNFKYKNGLNIDTTPFNPTGSCESGGLYYSSEDILAFVGDINGYIAEVELSQDSHVYKDPDSECNKWKTDRLIIKKKYRITSSLLKRLEKDGVNFKTKYTLNDLLYKACREGKLDIVKYLIEKDADNLSEALYWASSYGKLDIVKHLIEKGADDLNGALYQATYYGKLEVVKYLTEKGVGNLNVALCQASVCGNLDIVEHLVEKGANDLNKALRGASYGKLEVVKYLIEKGADDLNGALQWASFYGELEVVKYLKEKIKEKNN